MKCVGGGGVGRGGGLPRYFDDGVCGSIRIKAKSEKHIHNMTTIFYSYGCISINNLP